MRSRLGSVFILLARLAFATTLVLVPFRLNFIDSPRPFPPVFGGYTDFFLYASDVTLAATLAFWFSSLALQPRRVHVGTNWIFLPLAALTAFSFISAFFSIDAPLSFYHGARLVALLALFLYCANEIHSLSQVVLPVALQVALQSVIGIAQFLKQSSLGLTSWGELKVNPADTGVSVVITGTIRTLRAYGLSDHPNILGGCFAFGLLLLVGWYIEHADKPRGALMLGVVGLGTLGLFVTFSRAAWLAFAFGMLLLAGLLWRTRQSRGLVNQIVLAVVALLVVIPFAWQNLSNLGARLTLRDATRLIPQELRSVDERAQLMDAADKIFSDHALAGIGVGTFPLYLRDHFPDFPYDLQPVHMVWLDVAAETGIFGASAYAALLLTPWLALFLNRRRLRFSPALIGISAALLSVSIIGLFDYYTWLLAPGRLWQWFVWGLWAAVYRSSFVEAKND